MLYSTPISSLPIDNDTRMNKAQLEYIKIFYRAKLNLSGLMLSLAATTLFILLSFSKLGQILSSNELISILIRALLFFIIFFILYTFMI